MTLVELEDINLERFGPFQPLIAPENFLTIAVQLLLVGCVCLVGFVSYEVIHSTVKSRSLVKELSLAAVASVLIGFGTVVGMVGVGLYV